MLRALAALALLACSGSAAEKDPWLKITSPGFELYTTASERTGRDLLKYFEQVHSFFLQRFGITAATGRKAQIILFRNEKEYEPYRPNEFAAAFYHPGEYHDFIVMGNALDESRPVAVHELTHLMVHQIGITLPAWLNEGIADLYSNLESRGSKIMVGRDIPGRMRTLATEKPIPLRTLLAVDHNSPYYNEKARAGMFYAESWKLVHMLHLHPDYRPRFVEFLNALPQAGPEAAFRTVYAKDLETVQRDLAAYLQNGRISAMLFDIQLPKSVDAPEVEQGAAMPARLAIAEMLSNISGRAAQAHEAYESLSRDYPKAWQVEDGAGRLAWQDRHMEDASRHFAKAEELGCQDPDMFLLWGQILVYSRHSREAVIALSKAAKLRPESDEVQYEYGNALVLNGNWGSAVAALRLVKKVPAAGRWRYYYNLAYSLYRMKDIPAAKANVALARKFASTLAQTAPLDQLQAAFDHNTPIDTAPPEDHSPDAPPRIVRRDTVPNREDTPSKPSPLPAIEGKLELMDCGTPAKLHVRTADGVRVFVIPDPAAVHIANGGAPVDLHCGDQKNEPMVRIEYQAEPSGVANVTGIVRTIEFR
jgi:Flp pilus assembly protein TadD